jgi:hypothetical protein
MEMTTPLTAALEDARLLARQQAIDSLDAILTQRFAEIEKRLREEAESTVRSARDVTKRELTERLNHIVRRLRQSETRESAVGTLLEAATDFCGRAALFIVTPGSLRLEASRPATESNGVEAPLPSGRAFATAVESKDTVVSAATEGEMSPAIVAALGQTADRIYLFPIAVRQTVIGVLYAEPGDETVDVSALELLAGLSGEFLRAGETPIESKAAGLIRIEGAQEAVPARSSRASSWSELSRTEQEVHLRAQRFARTRVATLLLHKMPQVREGRSRRDLYGALREEIDAERQEFREQFTEKCPSMVDYYHLELVRTLAQENSALLGPGYSGPLP